VVLFGIHWRWFPVALWGSPWHAVLPVLALGLFFAGKVARLARESMSTVLQQEFILTARAKGVTDSMLLWRHALKPALLPVVSFSGPMLADLLTGSFVIESVFQIPGIGVFLVNSSLNKDHMMLVGLVLVYATLLLLLNLLVDLSYRWLDPRVKHE
jgi:oligopeptide transport system permease protein